MPLFKKKTDAGGDDDSSRKGLFGSRTQSRSPAPPSNNNPYANQPSRPMDPYSQAKMNAGVMNASNGSGYGSMRSPESQEFSGDPQGGGYGANKYGNDRGYGGSGGSGNPYGGNPYGGPQQPTSSSRQGGYGGLGPAKSEEDDQNRGALFGGAQDRMAQKQQNGPPGYEYNPASDPAEESRSYGAYGDRQLTAEEEEEEDIKATKQEIRFMKQQDVSSTRNALQAALQAQETGRNTLARLGAQGERLHNTKRNMDLAESEIQNAKEKTDALKRYNRSMFIPAENPFQSKSAKERRDQKIMDRHIDEREKREATRMASYRHDQGMQSKFQSLGRQEQKQPTKNTSLAERAKYQFEADSEDEGMENEIENNLDQLGHAVSGLKSLSLAMGEEIEEQNKVIENIGMQSDQVDNAVHMQTQRLKRIR